MTDNYVTLDHPADRTWGRMDNVNQDRVDCDGILVGCAPRTASGRERDSVGGSFDTTGRGGKRAAERGRRVGVIIGVDCRLKG